LLLSLFSKSYRQFLFSKLHSKYNKSYNPFSLYNKSYRQFLYNKYLFNRLPLYNKYPFNKLYSQYSKYLFNKLHSLLLNKKKDSGKSFDEALKKYSNKLHQFWLM
jgi:hypothetical protein